MKTKTILLWNTNFEPVVLLKVTWQEAFDNCESKGLQLAIMPSQTQEQALAAAAASKFTLTGLKQLVTNLLKLGDITVVLCGILPLSRHKNIIYNFLVTIC